jgi:tetratricopeptide (TPR) repeat protein
MHDEGKKPRAADREDLRHIQQLRATLGKRYLASFFTTSDDLAAKVTASVANVFGELSEAIGKLDIPLSRVIAEVARLSETPKLSVAEVVQEADNLQRDAMNWVAGGRYLKTAEMRLAEARRLIAANSKERTADPLLLESRGYVEKTAAQICERQGDRSGANKYYTAASRNFRAALKIDPQSVGALNGQADIYIAQGEYRKAATIGRVAIGLSPAYAAAYWDLGIALTNLLKKKPDAMLVEELADVYEKLVELIPNEPGGFTPADLKDAQESAHRYRKLTDKLKALYARAKRRHDKKSK